MDECIFCEIVAGRAPRSVIFEDDLVLIFMDIHQIRGGKVLVIPKEHRRDIRDLDERLDEAIGTAIRRASLAVSAAFQPDGLTISHNVGEAGGQDVFHAHFHVTPRYDNDGLFQVYPSPPPSPPREELDRLADLIRANFR